MNKIKIVSDGISYNTHVYLVDEKGKEIEIPYITKLKYKIDARNGGSINKVIFECVNVKLDLINTSFYQNKIGILKYIYIRFLSKIFNSIYIKIKKIKKIKKRFKKK